MKKFIILFLTVGSVISLAACAPKRYERKHSPVGASSVKKSSDKAQEKEQSEEAKSDEHDKEAIGTLSKADQADIYSIIENSASLTYSLQVQPTRLLELNNDHGAVDGYPQDMFIDYYNTYTPGTYNLQDVIDKLNAEETSDSIRSLSQDKLIQLTRRTAGSIRQKTRPSTKLYLVVVEERCHRWKSLRLMNGWSMKIQLK